MLSQFLADCELFHHQTACVCLRKATITTYSSLVLVCIIAIAITLSHACVYILYFPIAIINY